MSAGAPWSVKGIDPKAREVAKDLARRSGMTLGQWLNQMIIEGDAVGETVEPLHANDPPAGPDGDVAEALDRLTARIEAAEDRSAEAIAGIDESVRGALLRLEGGEREHVAVAARFEGAVGALRDEQARTAEHLRRVEAQVVAPRSDEALRALEGALGKVAGHLYDGEARTRQAIAALEARLDGRDMLGLSAPAPDPSALIDQVVARLAPRLEAAETRTAAALRELGSSFSALDGRLRAVEGGPGLDLEHRLEALSGDLSESMAQVRREMAEKLRETASGGFDQVERRLGELTAHVQAAEHRSAQAIERMGRDVISIADVLNRRVQSAENRGAAAIDQVSGEMRRIATSVEQRFVRADSVQAQALEKLGSEIARITEKLADRIGSAERRSALAIDDVGDQLARVADRLNQRQERHSSELVDRIRLSEERTARLLDEARETIDARLAETQRRLAEAAVPEAAPDAADDAAGMVFEETPRDQRYSFDAGPVAEPQPEPESQPEPEWVAEAPAAQAMPARDPQPAIFDSPVFETANFPSAAGRPPFADDDFEAADGFAPIAEVPSPEVFEGEFLLDAASAAAPEAPAQPDRPLSTREVIEQARAAARLAAQGGDAKTKKPDKDKPKGGSLFAAFGARGGAAAGRRRVGSTLATVVMVSGTAAAMGMAAAGMMLLARQPADQARVAAAPAGQTRAAIALSPQRITPAAVAPPAALTAAPGEDVQALYAEGVRRIEAKDQGGLEPLRRAANLGEARAQFYLAKLYEVGEGGVKKDLVEARRWTERAAQGGEARAMHNLALYVFKGEGGGKDPVVAASWFRKAADLGLVDSQFNLAQLYEGGWGVIQNPAEAYKWYLIADRAGDTSARARAAGVRGQLSAEARRTAERSAAGFRAQAAAAGAPLAADAGSEEIRTAQRALARLGYYQSPQDGVASPGLPMALSAYQRDQGLPTTGALDPETLTRLSAFAR